MNEYSGLKIFRKNQNLTQKQFANLIRVPVSTYQDWERQRFMPNKAHREQLYDVIKFFQDIEETKENIYMQEKKIKRLKRIKRICDVLIIVQIIAIIVILFFYS